MKTAHEGENAKDNIRIEMDFLKYAKVKFIAQ